MTVSSTASDTRYAGDGVTTVFSTGFVFFGAASLIVSQIVVATGVETVKVLTTNYSVSGGAGAIGSVTMLVAPPAGQTLVIKRSEPYTQLTNLIPNDPLPANVLQSTYDKLEMQIQQVFRLTQTAIQAPASFNPSTTSPYTMPVPVSGQVPVGNAGNTGWDSALISSVGGGTIPVSLVGLLVGDLLRYNNAGAVWENKTLATILLDLLTVRGDLILRGAATVARLPIGAANTVLLSNGTDAAWSVPPYPVYPGVRQTVASGPVDTAGLPTLFPATNASLGFTTTNVSATYPFVAGAANGWSGTTGAPVETFGYSTANLVWSGLTANKAAATPNFLYVTVAAGVATPGFTLLAPVYQAGGTPAVTAGQFTFNWIEMKGYMGNGATAPQANIVFVGEAATDATTVISTVCYAYNGRYDSGFTATLPAAAVTKNHNIGVPQLKPELVIECTTASSGYSIGDRPEWRSFYGDDGANRYPILGTATYKTFLFGPGSSSAWNGVNKTTLIGGVFTAANFKYAVVVSRAW